MAAIITQKLRILNAANFKSEFDLSATDRNMYLFISRSIPWEDDPRTTAVIESELIPPTSVDTVEAEINIWDEMLSLKKIIETTVSHAIRRNDYDGTGDTIYYPYTEHDADLLQHPTPQDVSDAAGQLYNGVAVGQPYTAGSSFVLTDEFNVYKCLEIGFDTTVNPPLPQKSTVKPTGTSTAPFRLADGYVWKYMYTISGGDALQFVTKEFMPVKTLLADDSSQQWAVQQAAVNGQVDAIHITAGGSGYINTGDETGFIQAIGASTVTLDPTASAIDNFYNDSTIHITNGTGAGQSRKILTYVGTTQIATLESDFTISPDLTSEYEILPTVELTGDGADLAAKPFVSGGIIERIDIISGGTGYKHASGTIIGGSPTGLGSTVEVIISPRGGHGGDATVELGGRFIIANVELEFDEGAGDFIQDNDYRRLGIVKDVLDFNTTTISTLSTLSALSKFEISSTAGSFLADEIIDVSGASTAQVKGVEFKTGSPDTLSYFQDGQTGFDTILAGSTLTGQISGATATIDTLIDPEVEKCTGDIIYYENRRPITRSLDQLENIKLIIAF